MAEGEIGVLSPLVIEGLPTRGSKARWVQRGPRQAERQLLVNLLGRGEPQNLA
jgi:hypothetical protein